MAGGAAYWGPMASLTAQSTALEAIGVSKQISGAWLLAPSDLQVGAGECVVVRGPNGSGKTTLLRILGGLLEPSSGTVTLDGRPVDERDPVTRAAMAALLGPPAAYRDLTLADHLVLVDSTWGLDPHSCAARVAAAFAELGIEHLAERFPHELSSGQQQLFRLALVLFRPGRVLLLDEPEQRLDPDRRARLTEILARRVEAGTALVLACHDPVMTQELADAVLDLREAR